MDTICVPAYANNFMARFEAEHNIPLHSCKALLFLIYTDDIFMIWNGAKEELTSFTDEL